MQLGRRSLLAVCTIAALVTLVPMRPAQAHDPTPTSRWRPPVAQAVNVTLADAFGRSLRAVRHQGRLFVAGEQGQRYAIRIANPSAERIEVVVSVDGRDVVSGSKADFARNRGYVVEPFGTLTIDGFRTSMQDVAAFRFSSVQDSYSARRGTAGNVGVIGVAVFKEKPRQPLARRGGAKDAPAAPSAGTRSPGTAPAAKTGKAERSAKPADARRGPANDPAPSRELGTAFGEQMRSAVVEVPFVRRSTARPDFVTTVSYDTARGLAARGVPIEPAVAVDRSQDDALAWPGRVGRFAPPPPR